MQILIQYVCDLKVYRQNIFLLIHVTQIYSAINQTLTFLTQ